MQEEKGRTKDETVSEHQGFNGQEFEQTTEDSEGQGSWIMVVRESDMTDGLN